MEEPPKVTQRDCRVVIGLTARSAASSQAADLFFIPIHWEWLCDTFPDSFNIRQAITCPCLAGKVERTKIDYVRVILANVLAQEHETPPFRKVGNAYFWN